MCRLWSQEASGVAHRHEHNMANMHTQSPLHRAHALASIALVAQLINMPYTVFQPLYIYGPHTAKDCEQWFIDRIARRKVVKLFQKRQKLPTGFQLMRATLNCLALRRALVPR
eukprot:1157357-Pelagomonas_calceolata.AAC.4